MHPVRLEALKNISKKVVSSESPKGPKVSEIFGANTFGLREMETRVSKEAFASVKKVLDGTHQLEAKIATEVAEAAKNWALSHGVTHFTHWFQPHTGLTAEKHDAFISYDDKGGVIEKLSGGQLIQSEPDASSFPSGGMRSTFEARGYTAWDLSSPLFIVQQGGAKILCIPSVFVSYTGHALDTKTSLLRSIGSLNKEALKLLSAIGEKGIKEVWATIGCEQEYFLIDESFVKARPDLLLSGRTLFGADMPKGQQLEDHYFGSIPTRVQAYMVEAEQELYRLGIPVKTRHNEVAPSQFETAPIFEEANIAADHNMMTMEILRKVAERHGFTCLLHEKPFAGVNGSGKHNNWSMATDNGLNLLEPGKTPAANFRFIAVLSCVLNAVYKNQVALRAAIAGHGNDHRLGANEAPPAIISVFVGSMLTKILETIDKGEDLSKISAERALIEFGLHQLPALPKDTTDRNRTSPFAFTGNKFEFRAVGSSQAISFPVSILNTAVAESMKEFVAALEAKKSKAASLEIAVLETAQEFIRKSKKILFEGNGYSEEWRQEAKKRGLYELLKTPDALEAFAKKEHHQFLVEGGVFKAEEIEALIHIKSEQYIKNLDIEAQTMCTMARQYVIPSARTLQSRMAESLRDLEALNISQKNQKDFLVKLSGLIEETYGAVEILNKAIENAHGKNNPESAARAFADVVSPAMSALRVYCDQLEAVVPDDLWPLPKYREMLFVR